MYENKIKSDAIHLRFGTMVHTVFERWFQEDADILEIYEQEWRKADVIDIQYYKDGIDMVKNFADETDKEEIMAIGFEQPFAINLEDNIVLDTNSVDFNDREQAKEFLKKIEEDDKPYIFGFIDRIDYDVDTDTLYIVDYKTSRIALTRQEANDDIQLSMYALVAKYLYPEYENVVLKLHYVRLGEKVYSKRTDEELEIFKKWLIHMYYQIKNDNSPKITLNKYCGWCEARHNCVAYQELVNTDLTTDEDGNPNNEEHTKKYKMDFPSVEELDAEHLDEQLEKLNIYIKLLSDRKKEIESRFKEELKSSDNSPIDVGGAERYVVNNLRTSYDVSTVIACFPDRFDELLTVKKTDVDKLAKGNPEIRQMLDETSERYFISPTLKKKKK